MQPGNLGGNFVLSKLKKMEVKETIAFIGGVGKTCPVLIRNMSQANLRLLFLAKENPDLDFVEQLRRSGAERAEVEVVDCAKNSCWEADIIAFVDPEAIEAEFLGIIREVSTQKVVLLIRTEAAEETSSYGCKLAELESDLPFSKVVIANIDSNKMTTGLTATNQEALETIAAVMAKAGYRTESVKE